MYSVYLRWHDGGRPIEQQTRTGDRAAALAAYRALLGRRDLDGQGVAAVLRDQVRKRTLLFSRFDARDQRLLPDDPVRLEELAGDADSDTMAIVAARRRSDGAAGTLPMLLKAYRANLGVTQAGLAQRWGVSKAWVMKAERDGAVAQDGALRDLLGQVLGLASVERK